MLRRMIASNTHWQGVDWEGTVPHVVATHNVETRKTPEKLRQRNETVNSGHQSGATAETVSARARHGLREAT